MSVATLKAGMATLLSNGSAWTQKALARDASALPCSPLHPDAEKWDIMGALIKVHAESGEKGFTFYHALYNQMSEAIPLDRKNRDIEAFNDTATWSEVAALLT
jgi:hypothetical protein